MRPLTMIALTAVFMTAFQPLHADAISEGAALAKGSDCLTCHQPTRKVVGPAYVDVAKKYKGQAGAVAKLVKKVKTGGAGNWGQVPMAAHPNLSDADLEKMVKWVLAGAPDSAAPAAAVAVAAPATAPAAPSASQGPAEKQAVAAPGAAPKKRKHVSHVPLSTEKAEVLAWATDEQVRDLMQKKDCFGCHQGSNRNGDPNEAPWPSFKKIEDKYKKGADVASLVKKVRANEGALKFGAIPHPAYEDLPAEAVEASVRYVLSGKAAQAAPKAADTSQMGAEEWMKTRSDCFSCHQVAVKVVGPAYKDVAKKYSEKDVAMLVKKVKTGGAGNWGNVPMAAHPSAPDEMLEKAVRWVLSQK